MSPTPEADTARLQISPLRFAAMIFVVCSAFSSQMVMPMWVGAVISDYRLSAQVAGSIASLELGMVAVVCLLAAPFVNRVDRRLLCLVGVGLLIAGNAGSAVTHNAPTLAALRGLCGVGKGLTVVGIFSAVAQTANPTRGFAILNGAYAAFSAFYFLIIPHQIQALGASGAFLAILAVTSVALVLLAWVPPGRPAAAPGGGAVGLGFLSRPGVLVLAGLTVMWIGYSAIWIFAQRLGAAHGLTLAEIGRALALGSLLTILGPVIAHFLSTRLGLAVPIAVGMAGLGVFAVLLVAPTGRAAFWASAPAFSLLGLFIVPYVMGLLSVIDPAGRLAAIGSSAMTLGGSLGSLVGGVVITQVGTGGLSWTAVGCFAAVLACILPVALAIDRTSRATRSLAAAATG